jgi:structural maintenance of chromosome 4
VVPDSDLVISRKAFRNNSSKYYINGAEANFTRVTTLLRDRGVDLDHKRFLILQGEVESIAQMKPKAANEHDDGLLEYLEDIIGTSQYKVPIEESAAEAETLNEVCVEKNSRVQHVAKEKAGLEDRKNKAIAYVKHENELALKQAGLYQIYLDECGDNIAVMAQAIAQTQAQLEEELGRHRGNEDEIRALERAHRRGAKECEALERSADALRKEAAKYGKENVKFEEKRKFLGGKQKKLEKAVQAGRAGISESSDTIARSVQTMESNNAQIAELEQNVVEEEKELASIRESLQGKTQVFSDQITAKQKLLEPLAEQMNGKQSAIAVAQSELEMLRQRCDAGAVAVEEAHNRIKAIAESRVAKAAHVDELRAQQAKGAEEAAKARAEMDKLARKEDDMRAQLSAARQKADDARSSLAATQSQGNVLSGLKRLHDSGRIQGFHGRLGNLGTIDQKYDVAISTACPALDNLVVDSVEVGQQCINYLRQNNLGRAMFILLNHLPHRDSSPIDTPEGVPRLFDLVKPKDDRFRPAFYSVLQNTLVANNLQQANRIAYGAKRWRVVTLDGQLIDMSGTMSGGGTRVARGGMSSKLVADVSKEQVAKFEAERDSMEQEFQAFKERQRQLETLLKELQDGLAPLETDIQKAGLDLASCDRNAADAQKRLAELEAEHQQPSSQSDQKQIAVLQKQVAALEKEAAAVQRKMAAIEEEIKALQDKIMEIGGVRLRAQKAKVDGLREQISLLGDETSAAEVAKAKAEKQQAKHEKSVAEAQEETESVLQELSELEQAAKEQEAVTNQSKRKAEEAQEVCLLHLYSLHSSFAI